MMPEPTDIAADAAAQAHGPASVRLWFERALEQPEAVRKTWLIEQIGDASLRQEVLALLAADAHQGALDLACLQRVERMGADPGRVISRLIGQHFGAYRLTDLLGQGGMATVFLGERANGEFEQRVAVKVLHRGLYTEFEQRLFQRERQILAALSHPNIVHLIDAGVTAAGTAYLVLEYVDGVAITRYADEQRLDVRARAKLVVTACRAAAAAHHRLVVHRDLKPSNILVTPEGWVKLLDFGIAKMLDVHDELATKTGAAVLTPGYAAPEQVNRTEITTATDVFSLGVVLYEMLTGHLPDAEPQRPSDRVLRDKSDPAATARRVERLSRNLRGDLDNIVLKALQVRPEDRYASAAELADDLDRYLGQRPIQARAPSPWYRARKFVARHRGSVTVALVALLIVLTSLAVVLWQAQVARRQAQRAVEVQAFVEALFEPAISGASAEHTPSLKEMVMRGRQRIEERYPDSTEVRADLLAMFARLNDSLGEIDDNEALAKDAWQANASAYGEHDERTHAAHLVYASVLRDLGRNDEALAQYTAVRAGMDRNGVRGQTYARVLEAMASALEHRDGGMNAALELKRAAVAEREADPQATHDDLAAAYNNLAVNYQTAGQLDQALRWYRRALATVRLDDPNGRPVATIVASIGGALSFQGHWRDANAMFEESLALYSRLGVEQHASLLALLIRACATQAGLELTAAARTTCDRALAMAKRMHGDSHAQYAIALARHAEYRIASGDMVAAAQEFAQAREALARSPGGLDSMIGTQRVLDMIHVAQARLWYYQDEAQLLRDALLVYLHYDGSKPDAAIVSVSASAPLHVAWAAWACQHAPAPACNGIDAVGERLVADAGFATHVQRLPTLTRLAEIDLLQAHPERVIARLESEVSTFVAELGARHSWSAEAYLALATAHAQQGHAGEGRRYLGLADAIIAGLPRAHPLHARLARVQFGEHP